MSEFLHLDMPLEAVIRASTIRPAQAIGWAGRIGSLAPGKAGDVALFALEAGEFALADSHKTPETAQQRLVARATICSGRVLDGTSDAPGAPGHTAESAGRSVRRS